MERSTLIAKMKTTNPDEQTSSYSVKKNSEEWRLVEFQLKSNTPYECEIKKLQQIYNSHMRTTFEKASKKKLTIFGWISIANLDNNNTVSKLRSRGRFDIQNSGLDFLYGSIFDNTNFIEPESNYILCKIIVGRSFCKIIKDKNELSSYIMDFNQKNYLPEGYDSVMFAPMNYFTSSYPSLQTAHKTIRYRIFESVNILPLFYCTFVPQAYHLNTYISKRLCDECSEKEADFFCKLCESNFCSDCFSNVHHEFSNDKTLKEAYEKHLLTKEPTSKVTAGMCDCNLNKEAEFYCLDCNKTICSHCKLLGSHSKGELVRHELIEIGEQYAKLSPDKEESLKRLNDAIKRGHETIGRLKGFINDLRDNIHQEAEKQLESESEKDYLYFQLLCTDDINQNITHLNLLMIMKDLTSYTGDYYTLRQQLVKSISMPEFIYVWYSYKRQIDHFAKNLEYYTLKSKSPDKSVYIQTKYNEFKVKNFNFDDSVLSKEKNKEEVTKVSSGLKKQVFDKAQMINNIQNTKLLKEMIRSHQKSFNNQSEVSFNNLEQIKHNHSKDDENEDDK